MGALQTISAVPGWRQNALSATEIKVGELLPDVPLLRYDDGRLLQTFRGAMLVQRNRRAGGTGRSIPQGQPA
jgi:hypothetical protein